MRDFNVTGPALLEIGAFGWNHPAWIAGFYPADLPVQWRLSYYANEFDTVLVPGELLVSEAAFGMQTWCGEVSGRFGFIVELEPFLVKDLEGQRILTGLDALGASLRGLVLHSMPHVADLAAVLRDRYPGRALISDRAGESGLPPLWRPGIRHVAGPVGLARFDVPPQTMPLRRLLESFMAASSGPDRALFLDAPYETLETARTIAHLLGY